MHTSIKNASAHHTIRATLYPRAHTICDMADGIRGDVVRRLRLERGWTQADLARETGIAQSTLSRIESGKSIGSYATTVRALARVYGCGEGDLVGDDAGELHTVPDDASPALATARPHGPLGVAAAGRVPAWAGAWRLLAAG